MDMTSAGALRRTWLSLTVAAALALTLLVAPATQARTHAPAGCTSAKSAKSAKAAKVRRARCARAGRGNLIAQRTDLTGAFGPSAFAAPASAPVPAAQAAPAGPAASAAAPAATPTPSPTGSPLPTGSSRAVQVVGSEWELEPSRTQVTAGIVRVEYNLMPAEDEHSLKLEREDDPRVSFSFGTQQAGSVTTQNLDLGAGTWRLYCDMPGHARLGMDTTLVVR
jgi:plastocyanin